MLSANILLQDRYLIKRQIGQGGMGAVYEAIDQRLENTVAVKQILHSSDEMSRAFEHEAHLLARLRYPNLPKVSDHFVDDTGQFLVMEFIPGDDLSQLLKRREAPFALEQILDWADQLLETLAYLHNQKPPVIHRDIKPHNLKLTGQGEIILLDFGLAKGFPGQADAGQSVAGYTLVYAAPEQIRQEGTDARSDLYSLAATLYDLMTGVKPADGLSRMAAVLNNKPDPLHPPHKVNPAIATAISEVLLKALALKPTERFATARDMHLALALAAGQLVTTILPREESSAVSSSAPIPPNNLPAQLTPLIGREAEINAVRQLLRRDDVRLVTLSGPGGIGKTRLGLQAAASLLTDYTDGVFLVRLSPIRDPDLVLSTVGQTLGVKDVGERPLQESVTNYLRDKKMLLLLDNFEQVIAAAPLTVELLATCPGLNILVTSREVLRFTGEYEFPVPPLTCPNPKQLPAIETLSQYEAVELFSQRATAVRPDFTVNNQNALAIAEICFRLDGLPLAIELAAARIKLFSPQALLNRLSDRFKLLSGGARDLPARHQTLRGAITWSYDLLEETDKALFRRLAIFVGGCTLEAAKAVGDAVDDLPIDILNGVTSLIDKSLLRQEEAADDEPRFVMLETIREYGLERLQESDEAAAVRQAHADFYLALSEEAAPELWGANLAIWLDRLQIEHDNLRTALAWYSTQDKGAEPGVRLAGSLWRFWEIRGHLSEGRRLLTDVLSRAGGVPPSKLWMAMHAAGNLALDQGDYEQATAHYEESLVILRELGNRYGIAHTLLNLGNTALYQGHYDQAISFYEEALTIYRDLDGKVGIALSLNNLAEAAYYGRDFERAADLSNKSLSLYRELGDERGIGWSIHKLGMIAQHQGDHEQALERYRESLALFHKLEDKTHIAGVLRDLGAVAQCQGDDERAVRLFGAAETLGESIGVPLPPGEKANYEHYVAAARKKLNEEAFAIAWIEGKTMTLEDAVAYAIAETSAVVH